MKVYIIGIGPGTEDYLLPIARTKIEEADCLIGSRRLLGLFRGYGKEEVCVEGHFDKVIPYIKKYKHKKKIAVLVSGDPGMYSLLEKISKALKRDDYAVIPGISTLQLAFARIGESWNDAKVISLHGRKTSDLTSEIRSSEKAFLLTDSDLPPNKIAEHLLKDGLENRRVVVMENLSYPNERIMDTDLRRLSRIKGWGLCAMIIKSREREARKGKLYGVGIGPGDPMLITLKAKEILDGADIIFVPKSSDDDRSYARAIVETVTVNRKIFYELTFPMTKDKAILNRYWKKAANIIVNSVRNGKKAAFITIGDPLIYSTYIYLLKILRRDFPDIDIETVPGISSFNAASSAVNLSLVEGNEKMAVVPVTNNLEDLKGPLKEFDTIILMKVGSKLKRVVSLLKEMRLVKNSILVSHVGHKDEKIFYGMEGLRSKRAGYLSIIIVRKNRPVLPKGWSGNTKGRTG